MHDWSTMDVGVLHEASLILTDRDRQTDRQKVNLTLIKVSKAFILYEY